MNVELVHGAKSGMDRHTSKKVVFAVAELRRQFEFSAERLSENAKTIKITLFTELLTVISP